jgi:hypothetical protein
MRDSSDLPIKQQLFPPHRMETDVSKDQLPIYSTINPAIPPFLPTRKINRFAKTPSYEQQIEILKSANQKKTE